MALIIRIDVDRPYGKQPFPRHVLSRLGSDLYFPKFEVFGYLRELRIILEVLNGRNARAYIFFRRCTLPSESVLRLIRQGRHVIGLHLENSRSFESFAEEKQRLERHIGESVQAVSKHGSGGARYGLHHYAPYEPNKYIDWGRQAEMKLFMGNLEDPSINATVDESGFRTFPAAFWLEPAWRNTTKFTIDWLVAQADSRDIVVLLHPENVLADPTLTEEFEGLLRSLQTRILE